MNQDQLRAALQSAPPSPGLTFRVQTARPILAPTGGPELEPYSSPRGLHVAGTRLYLAEYDSHRVWVWNSIPTQNNQLPNSVIGQPSPLSAVANVGGIGLSGLQNPYSILETEVDLYIADYGNSRVVVQPSVKEQRLARAGSGRPVSEPKGWGGGRLLFPRRQSDSRSDQKRSPRPLDTRRNPTDLGRPPTVQPGARRAVNASEASPF